MLLSLRNEERGKKGSRCTSESAINPSPAVAEKGVWSQPSLETDMEHFRDAVKDNTLDC